VHSPIDRAEALTHLSIIHLVQERPQEAIPLLEEALELITLESAPRLYLSVWGNLANAFYQQGSRARAEICLRQASVLAEQLGDRRNQATLLNNWGVWMSESGELEKAHQLYTQSLAIWREVSEPIGEAVCLNNLGDLMMQQGDYESARAFLLQSIEGTQRYRIWWYLHNPLVNMAEIARRQGKWETARWWAQQSLSAALRYAAPKQADKALTILVHSALELNDPRGAARAYALAERFECPITDPELLTRLFTQSSPEEVQRWCETMRQTSLEQILSELGPPAWIFDQTR
jgi:tetratricopeptide (TPR) repeat protein